MKKVGTRNENRNLALSHLKPWAVFIFFKDNMQNDFPLLSMVHLINGAFGIGDGGNGTLFQNNPSKRIHLVLMQFICSNHTGTLT